MPQPRAIVPDNGGVRPGLNSTGSDLAKYRIVKKSSVAVDAVAYATDGAALPYGVTMQPITNGFAGDVQKEGRAIVEASGPITIGQKVTGATGGKGAVATAAQFYLGEAASAAAADGELLEVDLGPGVLPA